VRPAALVAATLVWIVAPATAGTVPATLRVTSAADSGSGSLREAIHGANEQAGSTIEITLGAEAEIRVDSALPVIRASGTRLRAGGATLREGPGCTRPGGREGCDGVVIAGSRITVSDLRVAGFSFDGIAVRGRGARAVRIERVEAVDNLDDGIGVSDGAGPVTIEGCLLMGNGYRSKGKGLLVFDHSTATLRDSVLVANRDGITVSDGGRLGLERVLVAASYDKGLGVSGGELRGRDVQVLASGRNENDPGPNADGLRVGLSGSAELSRCRIAGSGDTGVVVLDHSRARLRGCKVEANLRAELVEPEARLDRR